MQDDLNGYLKNETLTREVDGRRETYSLLFTDGYRGSSIGLRIHHRF